MKAIEIINLYKKYRPALTLANTFMAFPKSRRSICALSNINLTVDKGELFCLCGPNRSGKSTLIKILATLITPTEGNAYVNGMNVCGDSHRVREIINVVNSEERSFYWRLTGRENLFFFGRFYNLSSRQIKRKTEELFDLLEITEPDTRFQEYSSGIKQRMAIARGLLNDPQLILMDEITKNLDLVIADKIRYFIKEELVRRRKKTVFYATHDIDEAEYLSDRVAFIVHGSIKRCFGAEELQQQKKAGVDLKKIYLDMMNRENNP